MTYPFIVFLHVVYLFGWTFISQKILFKKFSFKNYIFLSIITGLAGGIVSDIFGVIMFKLWKYPISAPAEYLFFILVFAYIVSVPFILETTLWIEKKLRKPQIMHLQEPSPIIYYGILTLSIILTAMFSFYQLQKGGIVDAWFIPVMLVLAATFTGSALSVFGVKQNYLSDFFQGRFLALLTPLIAGLITGLAWELLNSRIVLYSITNVPSGNFLDISIFALIGWGELNIAFYGVAKFLTESRFANNSSRKYFLLT